MAQWATVLNTPCSVVITFYMNSIAGAWRLMMLTGAGTGLVFLLRWYWWRINAWSEISAMLSAFVVSVALQAVGGFDKDKPLDFAYIMLITVAITTVVWLAVTYLTKPESNESLVRLYRKTHPSLSGWRAIAKLAPDVPVTGAAGHDLLDWFFGCVLIYGALFGVGKIIFHQTGLGLLWLAAAAIGAVVIYWDLSRRGWSSIGK